MPDFCESVTKKEELDEQFFDEDGVIPSIAIISYEPSPPKDMGFFAPGCKKRENRGERKKVEETIEKIARTPPEKEVEDKKEEDLELQLSPSDLDKVLVNGVELTQDST